MKKLLLASIVVLLAFSSELAAQRKWYVTFGVNGSYLTQKDNRFKDDPYYEHETGTFGAALGIHRMIGEVLSVGINGVYAGQYDRPDNFIGGEANLAFFVKLCDKLYYVPEIAYGIMWEQSNDYDGYDFDVDNKSTGGGISPIGLEFRPSESIGLRVNLVAISYMEFFTSESWTVTVNPSFQVCFRF